MSKTLTEMAAEILAARVTHEAMTSKQIESCLDDTFEALQKLKEREDAILGNAVQPIIKSKKISPGKTGKTLKTRRSSKKGHHRQHDPESHQVKSKRR